MRISDRVEIGWLGQEVPQSAYGAEPGGELYEKEQAAVATTPSTDWVKTLLTTATAVGKTALETVASLKAAKAKVAAAKMATKQATAQAMAVRAAAQTQAAAARGGEGTSPLVYAGIIGGGVVVLGILAYAILS